MTPFTQQTSDPKVDAYPIQNWIGLDLPYHPRLHKSVVTYSIAEIAHALRVSPSTVYRYKDRGLKLIQIGGEGGHTGVRHDDLVSYLASCPTLRARKHCQPRIRPH